jgi:hypothetical protein
MFGDFRFGEGDLELEIDELAEYWDLLEDLQ